MFSVSKELKAARRTRYLAELAEALGHAHRLLRDLRLSSPATAELQDLDRRIAAARLEARSLDLSMSRSMRKPDPERTNLHEPWAILPGADSPWQCQDSAVIATTPAAP
jgi:hypothetical protein